MSPALAEFLYATILRVLVPAYFGRLWWRGRAEPLYRAHWDERLGFGSPGTAFDAQRPTVWVHAVSLGETRAASALIEAMRRARPDIRILLTHGTATGREAGVGLLNPGEEQAWLPFDTPGAVRRFLQAYRPSVGVLMETEVWPGLQKAASQQGVPMVLANARLSEKSLKQGLRFAALMRPAAARFTRVLAQTEADAGRLVQMGAPAVTVEGNLKFDMTPSEELLARGRAWAMASDRPVILAASTRDGEEAALLSAWRAATGAGAGAPAARLLIVPRHPQRFDEVAEGARAQGLRVSRRSSWGPSGPDPDALQAEVWIGDSIGEMPAYYGCARVALLGGSFEPLGGQNLIEAAACGCPLVMGPSTFNFAQAAEASAAAGASVSVPDMDSGLRLALAIAADDGRRVTMADAALRFAQASRGAAQRQARAILALLGSAPA